MEKRMISCKHCGERIRPDEEKCPFCNKKLEVDYARLYPAYPNKKYHIFMPNSLGSRILMGGVYFFLVFCMLFLTVVVFSMTEMKPGVWIVLVPQCLPLLALAGFFVFCAVADFSSYMIWDGGDTVTIKKLRSSKKVSLSSISHISRNITVNAKGHAITRYIVIANEDTPVIAFYSNKEIRDFFLHFGIKEVLDNDMKYSWYREKMFGK